MNTKNIFLSILLILGGAAVFVLGNPYYTVFPTNGNQTYYVALSLFFLLLSVGLKRSKSLRGYWQPVYALIIASAALVFGVSHVNATYEFPGGGVVFGIVVFGLGVVGAYTMLKTDGLIGPILVHAGYDLVVISSILNSL